MHSRTINAIHSAMFGGLVILSPATSLATILYPTLFPGRCLVELCITGVITTLFLWWHCEGCPCTTWEKDAMVREGKVPYEGPWLKHYALKWFGVEISARTSSTTPMVLLAIPLVVGSVVEAISRLWV